MKYKITINNQTYEVDIENINARPVIAFVDSERFEVMPEYAEQVEAGKEAGKIKNKVEKKYVALDPAQAATYPPIYNHAITAPLPGTVVEVFVKAGDKVEKGQVVLIIEAMKMKNSIRSVFSGTVSDVLINVGESVAHKQTLVKFVDMGEA